MRKFWSEDEIKLLINLYENMGLSLSELMPIFNEQYNRSADAIKLKIIKCGLKHSKEQIKKIKSRLNSGSGNGMYNKISPTRGLNKETSEMIKLRGEKISKKMKELHKSGLLRVSNYFKLDPSTVLTYDEMMTTKKSDKPIWNVIVTPHDGDDAGFRHDVKNILLTQH